MFLMNISHLFLLRKIDHQSLPWKLLLSLKSHQSLAISIGSLANLLSNLKPHKASGPDNIPIFSLKKQQMKLLQFLAQNFQSSLDQGVATPF